MIRMFCRYLVFSFLAIVLITPFIPQASAGSKKPVANKVLSHQLDIELGLVKPKKYEMPLSSGVIYTLLEATGELARRADSVAAPVPLAIPSTAGTQGCKNSYTAFGFPTNIRVNQDCGLRRQAEEVVAVNPTDANNLIAGQNDSRLGFNLCGFDWSLDGGLTWGDSVPPFYQFQQLDGHTADACSDPTATFDATGNAYIGGLLFDVSFAPSTFVVSKSNAAIKGQFFHTPNSALTFQTFRTNPLGVVANDNSSSIFNDKEFIVADSNGASTKINNVYATWTRFNSATGAGVGANSPIYFSQSTDGGTTWSAGVEISGDNAAICTTASGEASASACDQNQGSDPIVGPDGTIYVSFGNGNTPLAGINQVLFVKCPFALDCSVATNWSAPVKVNDLIGTHPQAFAGNTAGCPVGRRCLPPNGYRVPEFTSISAAIDPANSRLYVTWSDFRNGAAPCNTGDFATSTPPCNNDVFYSYSTDAGATWSSEVNATPFAKFGLTAQWMPWSTVLSGRLTIAFYNRSYGTCETDGCADITAVGILNPTAASPSFSYTRVTTSSMPNLTTLNNPLQAGFLGDYMWIIGLPPTHGLVVWADTRGLNGNVEEDIYSAKLGH